MKKFIIGFVCLFAFACQSEKKNNENPDSSGLDSKAKKVDTLTFTYDSVKVYSKQPMSKDERVTDTSKAVIVFPKFSDTLLNNLIEARVCRNTAVPDKSYKSYKEVANSFMKSFDDYLGFNEDNIQSWFLDVKVNVVNQTPDFVALKFTQIDYMGGAHANSSFNYVNYDRVSREILTLDSILKPNTFGRLEAVAEPIFRKNEGLSPTQSLANAYFFDKDKFHLNSNFTLRKEGIEFLYNSYEIKPFSAGTTTLVVPYSAIKDLIKPNSPIYQINKDAGI
jgi:hypothetical protein